MTQYNRCGAVRQAPINRFGYVQPVATDPDYRPVGLGTAAVLKGIRRYGTLDATVAQGSSDLPFYLGMGFKPLFTLKRRQRSCPSATQTSG